MKKIMLIGSIGCGKTTLTQRLKGQRIRYNKTQAIEFHTDIIDTPGEFIQYRNLYSALVVTSVDAEMIVLMMSATENEQAFSPMFSSAFNKPCIGIVSKIDVADQQQIQKAIKKLELAGATNVFLISAKDGTGVTELESFLSID